MAQTYKFGNGTWARKKGSTLAYSDTNNAFKPLPFSFERNSIATRVNKEGLIEVVGNDIPRIDYKDSADGVLLLEPSRSNINTYSDPTDAQKGNLSYASVTYQDDFNWGLGNVIKNAIVFGDNSTTRYAYYNSTVVSGTEYTLSVIVKMDDNSVPIPATDFLFVLSASAISSGYNVESYGNNIYRVSVSATSSTNLTANGILKAASNSTKGFTISAFQIEQGSYATSYIPTSGSTVQRAAETANGSGNSEVFNDSEGVLFADISALADDNTFRLITLSDGTTSNRLSLGYRSTSNAIYCEIRNANVTQAFLITTINDIKTKSKVSLKYKENDFAMWVNGFEVSTDTSGITPINLSKINFDSGQQNGSYFYGNTKEIGYYDTILTDAELETLTSYRSLSELVTELNLNTL